MKRVRNRPQVILPGSRIKIRIDSRTVIVVRSQEAVEMWLGKYPGARIIP